MTFIKKLGELTRGDFTEAGGKAANLSEMTQQGFNVPPGFCVTGAALEHVIETNGTYPEVREIACTLDMNDYDGMEEKTARIREIINGCEIPDDLLEELTAQQSAASTLTGGQLIQLTELGLDIEGVFGYPQDVEWAYESGELFVLQSRTVKGLRERS